ncbi:L-serine ammonia-lyase, iron-sulfur-dependent, subunit alpha [Natranaerobius thermophilus]|uniref:L-serine dehydratase n=1 Tax=Natranaerobius thermophilus (strain ATCC BAA-1301 / DSM 18059 / JW/NM-WN-LF) TaxID=457570 RepID=B2A3H2_NATTJ|nr:L-serine ammonia-lyase, iron-sulfur-dependent, subunit alpha [Natranaerobius thermophilus]ACB86401.1 L-serine ammonia-lyase [Natranaerobius thermophilus JW/NM-WN-LF]
MSHNNIRESYKNGKDFEFNSLRTLKDLANQHNKNISWIVKHYEAQTAQQDVKKLEKLMDDRIRIMEDSVTKGIEDPKRSLGGLIGGEGNKMTQYIEQNTPLMGSLGGLALSRALAVSEVNASMGKIVASPTAGACGILPGVLLTVSEHKNLSRKQLIDGFFTASGIGMVVAEKATVAGAEGGCQAECGVGGAMAAGAAVELMGGSPEMVLNAVAISLKGVLGLVCDPVGGLVEVPCQKRNTMAVSQALASADMALADIKSVIPADEVIEAMYDIGKSLPPTLRETAEGGLAITPTGQKIKEKLD